MENYVGKEVQVCYKPRITAVIERWDEDKKLWIGSYTYPKALSDHGDSYAAFTTEFLEYLDACEDDWSLNDPTFPENDLLPDQDAYGDDTPDFDMYNPKGF